MERKRRRMGLEGMLEEQERDGGGGLRPKGGGRFLRLSSNWRRRDLDSGRGSTGGPGRGQHLWSEGESLAISTRTGGTTEDGTHPPHTTGSLLHPWYVC